MHLPWPFVCRAEELSQLAQALDDPTALGALVCGQSGVGKTRLVAEALRPRDATTHHVVHLAVPQERAADTSTIAAPNRRLVLLVDDGHLFDEERAADALRIATTGGAFLLVVLCSGRAAPRSLNKLWTNELALRLDIRPLDQKSIGNLLHAHLRGPVDGGTVADFANRCRGDLHVLREYTAGALESGALTQVSGVWRLVGQLTPSRRLSDLIASRLSHLRPEQLSALEVVAFAGRSTASELARLVDVHALEELEDQGLLETALRRREVEIRVAHPAYRDVLVAGVKPLRLQRLARELCGALGQLESLDDDDLLRAARWRVVAGDVEPAPMLAAARVALRRGDYELGEQLARAVIRTGSGLEASLLSAQFASMQGRAAQAEAELAELATTAIDNEQRRAIARAQVETQLFFLGLGREGLRLAVEYEEALDSPWRDAVEAASAATRLRDEGPAAAAATAEPLLHSARGRGLVLARLITAYGQGRVGKLRSAIAVARDGRQAAAASSDPGMRLGFMHVAHECDANAHLGNFAEAKLLAMDAYTDAIARHSVEEQGLLAWQLAKTVGDCGHVDFAIRYGREATALFRQLGRDQYEAWCLPYLALAFALAGESEESRAALSELEARAPEPDLVMGIDVFVARGWSAVSGGDVPEGRRMLEIGAALGERIGDRVGTAAALHGLARLGRASAVLTQLAAVVDGIEGPLAAARLRHTTALAAGDAPELAAVSEVFAGLTADLLAAEAQADAAVAWRRLGDPRRSAAAQIRASELVSRCGRVRTPALDAVSVRVVLTEGERQAAALAARGCSNREIAATLHIAVRTAESRLQRTYFKLGVHSRAELAAVLDIERDS